MGFGLEQSELRTRGQSWGWWDLHYLTPCTWQEMPRAQRMERRARVFTHPLGAPPPVPARSPTLGCSSCLEIRDISCRADASEALPSRPAGHTASPRTPPGLRLPGGRHWGAGDRPSSEATSPLAGRRAQLPLGKPSLAGHHPPGSSTGLGRRRRKKWGTPRTDPLAPAAPRVPWNLSLLPSGRRGAELRLGAKYQAKLGAPEPPKPAKKPGR